MSTLDLRRHFVRIIVAVTVTSLMVLAALAVMESQPADPSTRVALRIRHQVWQHEIAGWFALPKEGVPPERYEISFSFSAPSSAIG